jgi:O-antigen/teichoic acid export membrane protein
MGTNQPGDDGSCFARIHLLMSSVIERGFDLVHVGEHMQEVVRGATTGFLLKVAALGLGFGFNILLARLVGAEGAGIYYLAFNVLSMAKIVGVFGLDNALVRFVAAGASQRKWREVRGVYRQGLWLAVCISVVATSLIIVAASWISRVVFSEPSLTDPLRLMSLAVCPFVVTFVIAGALQGLKRIKESMIVNGVGVPLGGILMLPILAGSFDVRGAVVAHVLATVLTVVAGLWLWRREVPRSKGRDGNFDTGLLVATAWPLFWLSVMNFVMRNADTTLLGIWTDSTEIGIYSVAKRVANLVGFTLVAVNSILAPKFSALHAQSRHESLERLARNTLKLMTLLGVLSVLPLMAFPKLVLSLFGTDFTQGAAVLRILAIGQFVSVATGSGGYLLLMTGHEKVQRNNAVISACLTIILSVILIPRYNAIGAAIAASMMLVVKNMLTVFLVYRHLSIRMWFSVGGW